jgi:hypothetical protein
MESVATSAIIAGMCPVRNTHEQDVKQNRRGSFELLGVDLLVDEDLKVWLLEINITPGLIASSDLDKFIKGQVCHDMFNIVRLLDFTIENMQPCREYARIEWIIRKSVNPERIQGVLQGTIRPWADPVFSDYMIVREFVDEQARRRRWYRAYPKRKTMDDYAVCFDRFAYEDIVLREWVRLGREDRFSALLKNMDKYQADMQIPWPTSKRNPGEKCAVQ